MSDEEKRRGRGHEVLLRRQGGQEVGGGKADEAVAVVIVYHCLSPGCGLTAGSVWVRAACSNKIIKLIDSFEYLLCQFIMLD